MTEEHQTHDPYDHISVKEGAPFMARYGWDRSVSSVFFNQSWNAAFMMERHQPEYDSRNRQYRLHGASGVEILGEDRMCSLMASDLAEYWRTYHPEIAEQLLPHLTDSILHSSVRMLRGRIRKD